MHGAARMRVVVVETVREYAVHDHGVFQRQGDAHAQHRHRSPFGHGGKSVQSALGEFELGGCQRSADDVENVKAGEIAQPLRQRCVIDVLRKFCDRARK